MRINGLTVCVDYADKLALCLPRWFPGLSSLVVVTSPKDHDTIALVDEWHDQQKCDIRLHITNTFYKDGAPFNKSGAMEEARQRVMAWQDWCIFFDSDIAPPLHWKQLVESHTPQRGMLYGCNRRECHDESRIDDPTLPRPRHDVVGVGFFQLFHSGDERVQELPLLKSFRSAAGYDNIFMHRWPRHMIRDLGFTVAHLGRDGCNWCGRGNNKGMDELHAERQRRGGWQHEQMD